MKPPRVNGSAGDPGDDPRVTSIEEARRRASARAKAEAGAARSESRGPRDWIVGGVFIAMALGMIVTWLAPLFRTAG